ncbi:MAG TPA: hypothetical protein VE999_05425 [Gemmataceae bacterium]|nr:hypothetical protein [Gemmataceae bacterium]
MALRPSMAIVLFGAMASLGASYRTPNFIVEAPDPAFAEQVGKYAEYYRRQKAIEWLNQEMPTWGRPCPLRVTITGNSGGATEFAFDNGRILSINMHIEGSPDRLLASVLPHEITHTVLAYYFRVPVPRWADEGSSVLSEDERERAVHEQEVRRILQQPGRAIPLRRLFSLMNYPRDVMVLYAEGYSVANFLVGQSSRSVFLAFVAQGMQGNWDAAVRAHYPPYRSVDELERAWVEHIRSGRQQPTQLASRGPSGASTARVVVRQTAPPAQPVLDAPEPIYRGQIPDDTAPQWNQRLASQGVQPPATQWNQRPASQLDRRDIGPPESEPRPGTYQVPPPPPAVRLEAPEFERVPQSMPQLGQPQSAPRSPVGWSP